MDTKKYDDDRDQEDSEFMKKLMESESGRRLLAITMLGSAQLNDFKEKERAYHA